jgi:serine/threonine protein kinase
MNDKNKNDDVVDKKVAEVLVREGFVSEEAVTVLIEKQENLNADGQFVTLAQLAIDEGHVEKETLQSFFRKPGGRELGGFKIDVKIGEGGMGAVFRAFQISMNRYVALKVLTGGQSRDGQFIKRFYREAHAAARMTHPNIVSAIDVGEDKGQHYFAMELIEGISLRDLMRERGTLTVDYCLHVARQVTLGLQHAQEHNIIHRDIKPDNILLTRNGDTREEYFGDKDDIAKIVDLGIAKFEDENQTMLTVEGQSMGTPHYLSPEQARGDEDVDFRTDVYSLGATLYHMATDQTPYTATNPLLLAMAHVNRELPDPATHVADLSPAFCKLIHKMMAKNRDERPKSYDELLKDFENTGNNVGVKLKTKRGNGKGSKKVVLALMGVLLVFAFMFTQSQNRQPDVLKWLVKQNPKEYRHLKKRNLDEVTRLKVTQGPGENAIAYMDQLKNLKHIEILEGNNAAAWMQPLLRNTKIKSLTIHEAGSLTVESMQTLGRFSQLEELHLFGAKKLLGLGMKSIGQLNNLKVLSLTQLELKSDEKPRDERSRAEGRGGGGRGERGDHRRGWMMFFFGLEKLHTLDISDSKLSPWLFEAIIRKPSLKKLIIKGCGLSDEQIANLKNGKHVNPELKFIN